MSYKFLIYISYSYSLPIGLPLENEILKKGYDVHWFSDIDDGKKALSKKMNVFNTIEEVVRYRPDIVLSATNDVPDFISGLKVQIFHGFNAQKRPEKTNGFSHFRIRGFYDLYCTQGPSSTKGFLNQQKKHKHFEVIETGWSKVDPLFPLLSENLTQTQNTVLIASTFSERLSLAYRDDVYNSIANLINSKKYNFLMVLHPKLPKEIKDKWAKLNASNFTYHDTTDLIPLFKKANIMFADTTSAIQEFLLQKKSVVTFNHTFNHDYLINISKAKDIENALDKALDQPNYLLKNITSFIEELHPYYDGKSSERVINACISFLHKDKSHLKSKPLNLIRKFKIRKRLKYFTFKSYSKPYTV